MTIKIGARKLKSCSGRAPLGLADFLHKYERTTKASEMHAQANALNTKLRKWDYNGIVKDPHNEANKTANGLECKCYFS